MPWKCLQVRVEQPREARLSIRIDSGDRNQGDFDVNNYYRFVTESLLRGKVTKIKKIMKNFLGLKESTQRRPRKKSQTEKEEPDW